MYKDLPLSSKVTPNGSQLVCWAMKDGSKGSFYASKGLRCGSMKVFALSPLEKSRSNSVDANKAMRSLSGRGLVAQRGLAAQKP